MECAVVGGSVHWLDSVELLYAYNRSRESNGHPVAQAMHRQRESVWEHLPTRTMLGYDRLFCKLISDAVYVNGNTHPFHPETTASIHHLEEIVVLFTSKPVESGNFEITPKMTHIVAFSLHCFRIDV